MKTAIIYTVYLFIEFTPCYEMCILVINIIQACKFHIMYTHNCLIDKTKNGALS